MKSKVLPWRKGAAHRAEEYVWKGEPTSPVQQWATIQHIKLFIINDIGVHAKHVKPLIYNTVEAGGGQPKRKQQAESKDFDSAYLL